MINAFPKIAVTSQPACGADITNNKDNSVALSQEIERSGLRKSLLLLSSLFPLGLYLFLENSINQNVFVFPETFSSFALSLIWNSISHDPVESYRYMIGEYFPQVPFETSSRFTFQSRTKSCDVLSLILWIEQQVKSGRYKPRVITICISSVSISFYVYIPK